MTDLKRVYAAVDEETALYELERFSAKWDSKYPKISKSWQSHWPELSTYFKYPQSVRTLIYTTNSIENFNWQLRKVTKSKAVFPNDEALLKMLYLAQVDITKKMDRTAQELGRNLLLARNFLCRQTARIAELPAHIKGKMNG